jgi:uncharacterized protein
MAAARCRACHRISRKDRVDIEEMPPMSGDKKYLIVDDIYDSGDTYSKVHRVIEMFDCDFAFLINRCKYAGKSSAFIGKILNHNKWILFQWEPKATNRELS